MTILAVSPHLDDAILSAGSFLSEESAQAEIHIVTLFAGDPIEPLSPLAKAHHSRWGLGLNATSLRRSEDLLACASIGARSHHEQFVDAIYRKDSSGIDIYSSDSQLYEEPRETKLEGLLDASLKQIIEDIRPTLMLAPLGIGWHVDHILTRDAVRRVATSFGLPIVYWADVPYAKTYGLPTDDEGNLILWNEVACTQSLLDAAACYHSQVSALWPHGDWFDQLKSWMEMLYVDARDTQIYESSLN